MTDEVACRPTVLRLDARVYACVNTVGWLSEGRNCNLNNINDGQCLLIESKELHLIFKKLKYLMHFLNYFLHQFVILCRNYQTTERCILISQLMAVIYAFKLVLFGNRRGNKLSCKTISMEVNE